MNDWRTGYRAERIEYRLLGLNLQPRGVLSGVESCRVSGSVYADVRWGGQMVWSGSSQPDWNKYLVHPWYIVEGVGEFPICPPLFVKAPTVKYSGTVPKTSTLGLYDITYTLAKRLKLNSYLALPIGASPIATLVTRWSTAGLRFNLADSASVLTAAMNWDPGDSEMKVANGLLGALGYWSVSSDNYGVLQGIPYVDPSRRAPDWNFVRGVPGTIIKAENEVSKDDFDLPNRITGIPRVADGVTPIPQTVTLDNIDPGSPYTHANNGGFWVDAEVQRDVDAVDASALIAILAQKLMDLSSNTITRSVQHAWVPEVKLGSLVTYPEDGKLKRYTVQKMEVSCEVGGLPTKAEWKEVA